MKNAEEFTCLLCAGRECQIYGERQGFTIAACEFCGLRQVANLPNDATLQAYYAEWHMNEKYARHAKQKIWRWLPKLLRARARLGRGAQFLDVGCNAGFVCEAARWLGFSATGIEISRETIVVAQKLFPACEFEQISIQEHIKTGCQYDLVVCSEVIEHVNDVHGFLDALCAVVRPGGLLLLTTPDGGAIQSATAFLDWKEVCPPQHLLWLNKLQLLEQLSRRSFQVQWSLSTKKPSLRLVFQKNQ